MHRKIRTRNESFSGIAFQIGFLVLWYSGLLGGILEAGSTEKAMTFLPFLAAGLLPLYFLILQIRKACYYRKLHKKYLQGRPRKGRIVNYEKRCYRERAERGRIRTRAEYILIVEVYDPSGCQPFQIQSEAYSWPVYRCLASPEVEVYTDETGWHHVIDGFHYKKRKSDPDIFRESAFERAPSEENSRVVTFLVLLVMILIIISNLFFNGQGS